MNKITLGIISLLVACNMQAQFQSFDPLLEPQKGSIAVGDINNDGNLDVIFNGINVVGTDWIPQGHVMINNGTGGFTVQTEPNVIVTGGLTHIEFGDIDGDGDLDVIFQGTPGSGVTSQVGIALNDGKGVFTLADPVKYPLISMNGSCGFADFNNDGLLDYYIIGNTSGGVRNAAIFFHQPNGSFVIDDSSFSQFDLIDPQVSVVDFNNDGYMDIFITAWKNAPLAAGEATGRFCATFANDGFGHFTIYNQPNIISKSFGSASWGDVDGDGWLDLLLNGDGWVNTTENSDGVVRLYKNTSGTLVPKTTFSFFRQLNVGGGNKLVDWDNDGNLDVIAGGWNDTKARQATSLYLCTNSSNFTYSDSPLSDTYFPGLSEDTYEVADLNNDGKTDLLMMGFNGNQTTQIGKFQKNICGWCPNASVTASTTPAAPTNLVSLVEGTGSDQMVTLSWSAPTSESGKKGTSYNLAVKNKTTGKWLYNPMAIIGGTKNGWRQVTGMGNVCVDKKWELYNLPAGEYEWNVQAINGAYLGGAFATTKTFTIAGNTAIGSVEQAYKPSVYCDNNGALVISTNSNQLPTTVNVFTVNGIKVFERNFSNKVEETFKSGIYIVEVKSELGVFKTKVVVK
jgi:hypothetical protein